MLDYFERWLQVCKRHIGKKIAEEKTNIALQSNEK